MLHPLDRVKVVEHPKLGVDSVGTTEIASIDIGPNSWFVSAGTAQANAKSSADHAIRMRHVPVYFVLNVLEWHSGNIAKEVCHTKLWLRESAILVLQLWLQGAVDSYIADMKQFSTHLLDFPELEPYFQGCGIITEYTHESLSKMLRCVVGNIHKKWKQASDHGLKRQLMRCLVRLPDIVEHCLYELVKSKRASYALSDSP